MWKLNFENMPLKKKIILIAMASASLSLLVTCAIFILIESSSLMRDKTSDLLCLSGILSKEVVESWNTHGGKPSRNLFDSLNDNPDILTAGFYDLKGSPLVLYRTKTTPVGLNPPSLHQAGVSTSGGIMKSVSDVQSGGEKIGTLYLESEVDEIQGLMNSFILLTIPIWILALFLSFLIASHLQKNVSGPLGQVVDRMRDIARGGGDLTKRLDVLGKDEIGQMAEAFNTFVGKLQTVEEMKQDLIAVVSHQLKTPVAEINGFIDNMMEGLTGELNPRQKIYLGEMRSIGQGNYQLICDLLSASKIDRGILSADLKPVFASEVVSLAIRDYEQSLEQKGLTLCLEGLENDIELYADRDKTVEALRNLVNNAVKCTDKGTVTIRVAGEGEKGVIEVKDTGIGMDQETLKQLFTKKRVLGKEAGRAGAGLGLYISKNFMQAQKADITVTSEPGKGSCFKLVIPRAKLNEGAAA
jgi:signal transduction histidine kinase